MQQQDNHRPASIAANIVTPRTNTRTSIHVHTQVLCESTLYYLEKYTKYHKQCVCQKTPVTVKNIYIHYLRKL